jgi:hypothetical protein
MERIWKEAPVAQFEVLPWLLPERTEKNHDRWCLGRFELGMSTKCKTAHHYLLFLSLLLCLFLYGTNNLETHIWVAYIYCIWVQDEVFPQIWCLNMWGYPKFAYEVLNWATLNQTMQSQTKACNAKSPWKISTILRYYTAMSGNSLQKFQDNLSVPRGTQHDWN